MHYADLEPLLKRPAAAVFGPTRRGSSSREADESAAGSPATSASPRRVLVVEDNLDTVHSLVMLLRRDGHQVDFAINGYAALEAAQRFRPEVVLLDLGLPGLDGYEVCSRLRSEPGSAGAWIIAVSAYAHDEHRVRSRAAGCDLHVGKPYDPLQLLGIIRRLPKASP